MDANVYYANPLNPARRGPLVHYDPYYQYYDHSQVILEGDSEGKFRRRLK